MSEERFDRLESQISELRELMQQNMAATQQNMAAMNQNINAVREDVIALRQRIDSVEGSQNVIIREGFQSPNPLGKGAFKVPLSKGDLAAF